MRTLLTQPPERASVKQYLTFCPLERGLHPLHAILPMDTSSASNVAAVRSDGGCLCGAVTFTLRSGSQPYWTVICHCKNCQKATGSVFATNGIFLKDDVVLNNPRHALRVYVDGATDSGTPLVRKFCMFCGSSLFATTGLSPDIVSIFGGAFNDSKFRLEPPFKEQYIDFKKDWLPDFGPALLSKHPRGCHTFTREDGLRELDLEGESKVR